MIGAIVRCGLERSLTTDHHPASRTGRLPQVATIPGGEKLAFIFGGSYGRGLATCRTAHGWSAPMFLAVGGGSVGFRIGGSFTDGVLLFMNDHALQSLLNDTFKIGADVTVAAGPVGRNAAVGTDLKRYAKILSAQQGSFFRNQLGWRRRACRPQRRRSHVRLQCHAPGSPGRQNYRSEVGAACWRNFPSTPLTIESRRAPTESIYGDRGMTDRTTFAERVICSILQEAQAMVNDTLAATPDQSDKS
jgi:hypothetical protein